MISQEGVIRQFQDILLRQNCQKTMPFTSKIHKWFDDQPQQRQAYLGRIDFRCERDQNQPNQQNTHRCHTVGLAIAKYCFIYAVKTTDWRPSKRTIYDLLNKVINYPGNFVICHSRFNYQWRDGGQRTLRNILQNYLEEGIVIPELQVDQLIRVLNGIRKRYYKRFFRKCLQYGVSPEATKQIKLLMQLIYAEAMKMKNILSIREIDTEDSYLSEF